MSKSNSVLKRSHSLALSLERYVQLISSRKHTDGCGLGRGIFSKETIWRLLRPKSADLSHNNLKRTIFYCALECSRSQERSSRRDRRWEGFQYSPTVYIYYLLTYITIMQYSITTCKENYFKKIAKSNFLKYITPTNLLANRVNNNALLMYINAFFKIQIWIFTNKLKIIMASFCRT